MLIVNALFAVLTISAPTSETTSNNDLVYVINHLDDSVEWTSSRRTETLSRNQAITKLQALSAAADASFELKHKSAWKNNRCYKVIELTASSKTYRIFFYCQKNGDETIVNRIKISEL